MTTTTFHGTGSQSEQFSLKWNNFHSNLSSGFHDLLEEEDLVDVTLACEGQFVQAHKIVLSVCSPYFKNLFKINPCKHPIVILKDVRHRDLQSIIQFMYLGVTNVRQDELSTFLKTAESLKIKGLTEDEKNQAGRRQTSSKSNGNENQQADEIHEPVVNISTPKVPLEIRGASTPPPAKRRTRTAPQPVPAPVMTITEEPQSVDSPGASVDSARSNAGSELTFEMVPTNRPKLEPVDVEMNSEGFEAHYLEKSGRDDIEPEEQELSSDMLSDSELNASDLGLKISQARGNVLHGQAGPSTSFDSGLTVHPIGGDSAMSSFSAPGTSQDMQDFGQGYYRREAAKRRMARLKMKKWQNIDLAPSTRTFECPYCHITFTQNSSFRRHMSNQHGENRGPFACKPCGRVYKNKASFEYHVYSVHKERTEGVKITESLLS